MAFRRRGLWIALSSIVLAGSLGIWLYTTEWVELRENSGYGAEAMLNPFLAARLFLQRLDVDVESSPGLELLDHLPPTSNTLLVASSWRTLSQRRVDALIQWVTRGGHLIMPGMAPWNARRATTGDPLLDFLQVQVQERPAFSDELTPSDEKQHAREELMEMAQTSIDANALCGPVEDLAQIRFAGEDDPLVALFTSTRSLIDAGHNASAAASNRYGTQLLQFEIGDGLVTVLTTLRLWRNRIIACHDHAHMLRLLVGTSKKIWWLYDTQLPALPVLVWRNAAFVVLGALLFIVLLAWRSGVRLGPAVMHAEGSRRQLMEHIEGVARFYWQHRSGDELLDELREEIMHLHRARTEHGSGDTFANLAAIADVAEEDVRWAFSVETEHRDATFHRAVTILQTLRKSL